jgi:hypothetical protein
MLRITKSATQEEYNQNITQIEVALDLGSCGGKGLQLLCFADT